MSEIGEVRFDIEAHEVTPIQVEGLLKAHDDTLDMDVGVVYGGKAGVTFDVPEGANGDELVELIAITARGLGLTVVHTEVLSSEEYEERAWSESEVDPNG